VSYFTLFWIRPVGTVFDRMIIAWNDHLPEGWGQSPGDLESRSLTGSEGKSVIGQGDEVGKEFVSV
jgi:hypothetical protein